MTLWRKHPVIRARSHFPWCGMLPAPDPAGMESPSYGPLFSIGAVPADLASSQADEPGRTWPDYVLALARTVATAAVYTMLMVTFGFQIARVDGQSMAPTLSNRDRLIADNFMYHVSPPRARD